MTVIDSEASFSSQQAAPDQAPYVRLHVTPLDADLLQVLLSSAVLPKARNISYHSLQTFPDKRYGFVELPNEDAEKIKKKFHGSILRGVKIRIERARPSRIPAPLGDEAMAKDKAQEGSAKRSKDEKDRSKKRKRAAAEEISGIVLENDRKVKRGWTTADEPREKRSKKDKTEKKEDKKDKKEKRKQERSKYTDHAECLVKTILPANAVPDAGGDAASSKKKKGKAREVVVHEFERTTKYPTFLKTTVPSGPPKPPLGFVDGKGWVDEDGNIVEVVKTRPPPATFKTPATKKKVSEEIKAASEEDDSDSSSSSSDSSSGSGEPDSSEDDSNSPAPVGKTTPPPPPMPLSQPGPSPVQQRQPSPSPSPLVNNSPDVSRPKSSGSAKNLAIKIPPTTPSEPKVVHPLEALYKRSQQAGDGAAAGSGSEQQQAFSFFGQGDDVESDEEFGANATDGSKLQVPMTPFTRQDFESRGIRSAAPTPDTAHPKAGRFKPWEDDDDEDMDDAAADEEMATPGDLDDGGDGDGDEDGEQSVSRLGAMSQAGEADGNKPTSDFQKWFWENRGDLNRSWKKRRKTASKEKRYRENRARMSRAI
ncbi:hypothetical protein QBC35DRAFT_499755 [Podospora australis]|uniref:RRM domain-containing protein n=1 Tax=Podospora australis TaxID=1536484 RepID=A0AAN7AFV6_9PEZI|nr:hypothetical protein QBC35DRAFT_499755 [Podospora australis]